MKPTSVAQVYAALWEPGCAGGCGITERSHARGFEFLGTVHFAERRLNKTGLRNLLLLIARARRLRDPEFLNVPLFDWFYRYSDAAEAQRLAAKLHTQLPRTAFDHEREMCRALAARRNVALSRYKKVWRWLNG